MVVIRRAVTIVQGENQIIHGVDRNVETGTDPAGFFKAMGVTTGALDQIAAVPPSGYCIHNRLIIKFKFSMAAGDCIDFTDGVQHTLFEFFVNVWPHRNTFVAHTADEPWENVHADQVYAHIIGWPRG